jgi:hypothetical protein
MSAGSVLDELIPSGEGPTVDFKKSDILSNPLKLAALMVAFANTSGGRILIGVNNDGSIEGMLRKNEHESHIMNIARDKCAPPIIPEFSLGRKNDGDVYIVKVMRFRKLPHAVITKEGNVYFIRVGSTVRQASPSELALLFESGQEIASRKKPELELLLINEEGDAVKEICAEPTFVRKIRRSVKPSGMSGILAFQRQAMLLASMTRLATIGEEREPPKDMIPIGIQITNAGEVPAQGIRISLRFPTNCRVMDEHDVIGGFRIGRPGANSGGLFADTEKFEAYAWIDTLGNDLTMRSFEKVYVRFPETEQQYKIQGGVTQYSFPPTDFQFSITIKPKFVEEVEEVYDENP